MARVTNMRGVNVSVFEFDFDLTWMGFFLNADETVYGRFGGRDATSPDKYLTLPGLKQAMRAALDAHRTYRPGPPPVVKEVRPEQSPAAKRTKADACIHCHNVYEFRREELREAGKWTRDEIWKLLSPSPEVLGLLVDPDIGNRLHDVPTSSPAAKAGLKAKDELLTVAARRVASFADLQYALQKAPAKQPLVVTFRRDGRTMETTLAPRADWRQSDISWRPFMWGLEPAAGLTGRDLPEDDRKELRLSEKALAFYQDAYPSKAAVQAGVKRGDVVLGIAGKKLEMTVHQFNAYVRLNYESGDVLPIIVLRDGKRLEISLTLTKGPQ